MPQQFYADPIVKGKVYADTKGLHERDWSILLKGRAIKVATLRGEWYVDVDDPELSAQRLRNLRAKPDIFSFWQRLPEVDPCHSYFMEWDNVTAIRVTTYEDWLANQADKRPLKKSKTKGVEVRVVPFGDELLRGISSIFNEAPIRQGKPMRHYGKTPEMLRGEYLPEVERTYFLGAFLNGEIIGFLMLVHAGSYLNISQIMSKLEHWDKSPNNALIAKAVEICAEQKVPYLVYTKYYKYQGVTEFKRRNGFQRINLPRYFIPITWRGKFALHFRLHKGVKGLLPDFVIGWLLALRTKWYSLRYLHRGPLRG
jgi:hypothetical protein